VREPRLMQGDTINEQEFHHQDVAPDEKFSGAAKHLHALLILACSLKMGAAYIIAAYLPTYYLRAHLPGYTTNGYATANCAILVCTGLFSSLLGGFAADRYGDMFGGGGAAAAAATASLIAAPLFAGVWFAEHFQTSLVFFALALAVGEGWLGLTMAQLGRSLPPNLQIRGIASLIGIATFISNLGPAVVGIMDGGTGPSLGRLLVVSVPGLNVGAAIVFAVATSSAAAVEAEHAGALASEDDAEVPLLADELWAPRMRKTKSLHFTALGHADVSFSMATAAELFMLTPERPKHCRRNSI